MSLSDDGKELQVCFDSDYDGNIWISLKVEDVKKMLEKCACGNPESHKNYKNNMCPVVKLKPNYDKTN